MLTEAVLWFRHSMTISSSAGEHRGTRAGRGSEAVYPMTPAISWVGERWGLSLRQSDCLWKGQGMVSKLEPLSSFQGWLRCPFWVTGSPQPFLWESLLEFFPLYSCVATPYAQAIVGELPQSRLCGVVWLRPPPPSYGLCSLRTQSRGDLCLHVRPSPPKPWL